MLRVLWGLTVRPLCQDRRRSTLSVLGIALGIALIFSVNLTIGKARLGIRGSGPFGESADQEITSRFGELIPEKIYAKMLKISGVVVLPVKAETVKLESEGKDVLLVATDLIKLPYFTDDLYFRESWPSVLESLRSPSVYVGQGLWNRGDAGRSNSVVLKAAGHEPERMRVLGKFPGSSVARPFILADISQGERLLGPGLDRILVRVTDSEHADAVLDQLKLVLTPDLSLSRPRDRILRTEDVIRSFDYNLRALSFMALLIGMFLVYNTIFVSVIRRRREIGILRTLGLTRMGIMSLFTLEAGIIGAVGSLLGVAIGVVLSSLSDQGVAATLRSLYGLEILNPEGSILQWIPLPLGVGLIGSITASLGPAYEASSIAPAEAMRDGSRETRRGPRQGLTGVVGVGLILSGFWLAFSVHVGRFPFVGFGGLLMLVLGAVLIVPFIMKTLARASLSWLGQNVGVEGRIGVLNILGNTARTSMAVAAIAVSLACTLGILMLIYSFRVTVEEWVDGNLSADVYIKAESCRGNVFCNDVLDAPTLERLRKVPGLRDVYAFRGFEFDYKGQKTRIGFSDVNLLHKYSRVRYLDGNDPDRILKEMMEGDHAIVSEPFAHRFGTGAGDTIQIPARAGKRSFTVSGVFFDYSTELGYVILDRRFLQPLFGVNDAHTVGLYFDPRIPPEIINDGIREALAGRNVVFLKAEQLRQAVLAIFDRTFAVTRAIYAIALVVALMAVANTLFALVVDRKREISVLRYLGMDGRQLFRMILSESILIAVAGSVTGLLLGLPIGLVLIFVINRQSFGWTVEFHLPAFAMGVMFLGMLLMTVVSSWFPYRLASHVASSRYISHE